MIVQGIRWPTPSRPEGRPDADGVIMPTGDADRTRMPNAYANIGGWRMSQR